jgi:hypothetical protein
VTMQNGFLQDVLRSTWNTRGWILQERLLSSRLIHLPNARYIGNVRRFQNARIENQSLRAVRKSSRLSRMDQIWTGSPSGRLHQPKPDEKF